MRSLTKSEIELINSDLEPFNNFFINSGLFSQKVLNKYNGIKFMIEEDSLLKGASGQVISEDGVEIIKLKESDINEDRKRAEVVYHEIGHEIMGLKNYSEEKKDFIINSIISTKNNNPNELKEHGSIYLEGINLLEEYLVQKFAMLMLQKAKGYPKPQTRKCKHPQISGNYIYDTTFDSSYGIIESLGNNITDKMYGNINNTVKAGLKEDFFIDLFKKFDKVELMKILEKLGHVKNSMYSYVGHDENNHSPAEIEEMLYNIKIMIKKMQTRNNPVEHTDIYNEGR